MPPTMVLALEDGESRTSDQTSGGSLPRDITFELDNESGLPKYLMIEHMRQGSASPPRERVETVWALQDSVGPSKHYHFNDTDSLDTYSWQPFDRSRLEI